MLVRNGLIIKAEHAGGLKFQRISIATFLGSSRIIGSQLSLPHEIRGRLLKSDINQKAENHKNPKKISLKTPRVHYYNTEGLTGLNVFGCALICIVIKVIAIDGLN